MSNLPSFVPGRPRHDEGAGVAAWTCTKNMVNGSIEAYPAESCGRSACSLGGSKFPVETGALLLCVVL